MADTNTNTAAPVTPPAAPAPGSPEWRAQAAAANAASIPAEFKNADGSIDMVKLTNALKGDTKSEAKADEAPVTPPSTNEAVGDFDANRILTETKPTVDLWAKAREEAATGVISAETRKALKEKHGVSDDIMDNLAAATKISKENHQRNLLNAAGGKEVAVQALEYAKANFKGEQFAQFQRGINDPALGPTVMRGIVAEMQSKNAQSAPVVQKTADNLLDNSLGGTGEGKDKITPFATFIESQQMILDPRMRYDRKFQELYAKRVLATREANSR